MKIDIWSDIVCPWCYIGKRRLEAGLEAAKANHPDLEVEIRYHAYQLDPTAPVGAGQSVREVYEKKFGGPEQAEAIIARTTGEAAKEGLGFNMDIAQRANTVLGHRLMVLAEQRGLQIPMKDRLMAAYFIEGQAIGLPEVLTELAVEVGLDRGEVEAWLDGDGGRDEVAADLHDAADHGISAVPTYVFNEQFALPGAVDADQFEKIISKLHLHELEAAEVETA